MRLIFFPGLVGATTIAESPRSGLMVPVTFDGEVRDRWIALDFNSNGNWVYSKKTCPFTQTCSGIEAGRIGSDYPLSEFRFESRTDKPNRDDFFDVVGAIGLRPDIPYFAYLSKSGDYLSLKMSNMAEPGWEDEGFLLSKMTGKSWGLIGFTRKGEETQYIENYIDLMFDFTEPDIVIPKSFDGHLRESKKKPTGGCMCPVERRIGAWYWSKVL